MCPTVPSGRGTFTKLRDFGEFGDRCTFYASLRGGVSPNDLEQWPPGHSGKALADDIGDGRLSQDFIRRVVVGKGKFLYAFYSGIQHLKFLISLYCSIILSRGQPALMLKELVLVKKYSSSPQKSILCDLI